MQDELQLDHLTDEEKRTILAVLDRNEKILKQETVRIKNLEKNGTKRKFSRIESVKVRTGEWMKEFARPTFNGRRRGTDIVRRSVKIREEAAIPYYEPTTTAENDKEHHYTPNKGQHRRMGSSRKRAKNLSNEKQVQFAKESFIYEDENAIKMDDIVAKPDIPADTIPTIVIDQTELEETINEKEEDIVVNEPTSKSFEDVHSELAASYGKTTEVEEAKVEVHGTEEDLKKKIANLQNEIQNLSEETVIVPSNTPEKKIYQKIKRKGSSRRRKESPKLTSDGNRNDIFSSPSADEKSQEITNIATEIIDDINKSNEAGPPSTTEDVSYGMPDISVKKQVAFSDDVTVHVATLVSNQLAEDVFKSLDSILADSTTLTPESPNETPNPFEEKEESNYTKPSEISIIVTEDVSKTKHQSEEEKYSPGKYDVETSAEPEDKHEKKDLLQEENKSPYDPNESILTSLTKEVEKVHSDVEEQNELAYQDKFGIEPLSIINTDELIDFHVALGSPTPELSGGSNPSSPHVNIIVADSSPRHSTSSIDEEDQNIDEIIQAAKEKLESEVAMEIRDSHDSSDNPPANEANVEESPKEKKKKVKKVVKVVKKKIKKMAADITPEGDADSNKDGEGDASFRISRRRTAVRKKVVRKKPNADVEVE